MTYEEFLEKPYKHEAIWFSQGRIKYMKGNNPMTLEEYICLPYRDRVVIFNCFGVVGIKFDADNKPIKDSSYLRNDLMYSTDFYSTIIK